MCSPRLARGRKTLSVVRARRQAFGDTAPCRRSSVDDGKDAIIQKKVKRRGVEVTFSIPVEWLDRPVSVVGDFNDWDPTATPLHRTKKGKKGRRGQVRTATVVLEPGRSYAFRYVDDDERWFDDPDADRMVPNALGGFDGVIDVEGSPSSAST